MEHYREQGYKLDDRVYGKDRAMRLWGCSKYGEERPLQVMKGYNEPLSFQDTLYMDYDNNYTITTIPSKYIDQELVEEVKIIPNSIVLLLYLFL